jgi:chromosome segregation ATPase
MDVTSLKREKSALARRLEELHSRRQINLEQRAVLEEVDVDVDDVKPERVDPAEQLRRIAQRNFEIRRRLEQEDARLTRDIEALQKSIRALDRQIAEAKG